MQNPRAVSRAEPTRSQHAQFHAQFHAQNLRAELTRTTPTRSVFAPGPCRMNGCAREGSGNGVVSRTTNRLYRPANAEHVVKKGVSRRQGGVRFFDAGVKIMMRGRQI